MKNSVGRAVKMKYFSMVLLSAVIFPHSDGVKLSSLSDYISGLLQVTKKPAGISLRICDLSVEMQLLVNLTSGSSSTDSSYMTERYKAMTELGGQEQTLIILDVNCNLSDIQSVFQASHFSLIYSRWLLVDSRHPLGVVNEGFLLEVLQPTPIAQSTEIFFFSERSEELLVKQAYKRAKVDEKVVFEDFGSFLNFDSTNFQSKLLVQSTAPSIRRRDMDGSDFNVALVVEFPDTMNHLYDYVDAEVDAVTKNGFRLSLVILEFLNARPQLVVSDRWGAVNPSASNWTGMLGDLDAGKSEFAGTPATVRESRLEACDYLSYSVRTGTQIVFRAPKLSYTTNVFLLPFDRFVWLCAGLIIMTVIGLLAISTYNDWNTLVPANALVPNRDMLQPRLSDIGFMVLGSIFVQGSAASPKGTAGRIINIFCLIFIVFLYVSYTAFIVALLQSPATNIKTVADLLESHMEVGNQDNTYHRFWVAVSL